MEQEIKALVIGRHSGEIPGVEVIESRHVTFPATGRESFEVLRNLGAEAKERGLALLFQAVPGQLAAALVYAVAVVDRGLLPYKTGIIINKPGLRPARVEITVNCSDGNGFSCAWAVYDLIKSVLIKSVNPNARVNSDGTSVAVLVDPPLRFEFDHIEWL